jgi:hypothetical protein
MTADPHLTRRTRVDVVIHVSAIVCLDLRWTRQVPSPPRPHTQRRARADAGTHPYATECAHPNTVAPGL